MLNRLTKLFDRDPKTAVEKITGHLKEKLDNHERWNVVVHSPEWIVFRELVMDTLAKLGQTLRTANLDDPKERKEASDAQAVIRTFLELFQIVDKEAIKAEIIRTGSQLESFEGELERIERLRNR